jgi:hypothetical protein
MVQASSSAPKQRGIMSVDREPMSVEAVKICDISIRLESSG